MLRRSPLWPDPRAKPPYASVQVNASHPAASYLTFASLLNTSTVMQFFFGRKGLIDCLPGAVSPVVSPLGVTWNGTANQRMLFSRGGVALAWSQLMGASAKSIVVGATPTGSPVAFPNTYDLAPLIGDTGQFMGIYRGNRAAAGDGLYVYNFDVSDDFVRMPFTLGARQWIGYTHDGTTLAGFLNGALMGTTASGVTGDTTGLLQLGNTDSADPSFNGTEEFVYCFDTALPVGVMQRLTMKPFELWTPLIRRRYFMPAAAGAGIPTLVGTRFSLAGPRGLAA